MTADPRALLDAYAAETDFERGDLLDDREHEAPAAIAALRAVLELADHYDDLGERIQTESAAEDIRQTITTALEAS